jgi:hypothetical protein
MNQIMKRLYKKQKGVLLLRIKDGEPKTDGGEWSSIP